MISSYYYNSDKLNKSFLVIPKNATSSIRAVFGSVGRDEHPGHKVFSILRSPYTRAYSGYQECLRRRTFSGTFYAYLKKIEVNGYFDEHSYSQTEYFRASGLQVQDVKWFKFEEIAKIEKYLGYQLPLVNASNDDFESQSDEEIKLIHQIYELDYLLLQQVFKK